MKRYGFCITVLYIVCIINLMVFFGITIFKPIGQIDLAVNYITTILSWFRFIVILNVLTAIVVIIGIAFLKGKNVKRTNPIIFN